MRDNTTLEKYDVIVLMQDADAHTGHQEPCVSATLSLGPRSYYDDTLTNSGRSQQVRRAAGLCAFEKELFVWRSGLGALLWGLRLSVACFVYHRFAGWRAPMSRKSTRRPGATRCTCRTSLRSASSDFGVATPSGSAAGRAEERGHRNLLRCA